MTTIAATLRMMAADSRTSWGQIQFPITKIRRTKMGIIGAAGDNKEISDFMEWAEGKRKAPGKRSAGFEAMVLNKHGLFMWTAEGPGDEVKDGYFAIGSGGDFAMGSLATQRRLGLDMDPRLAVEAACERDAGSGPPIDFLTLRIR